MNIGKNKNTKYNNVKCNIIIVNAGERGKGSTIYWAHAADRECHAYV